MLVAPQRLLHLVRHVGNQRGQHCFESQHGVLGQHQKRELDQQLEPRQRGAGAGAKRERQPIDQRQRGRDARRGEIVRPKHVRGEKREIGNACQHGNRLEHALPHANVGRVDARRSAKCSDELVNVRAGLRYEERDERWREELAEDICV
jgi:hypothetical protein